MGLAWVLSLASVMGPPCCQAESKHRRNTEELRRLPWARWRHRPKGTVRETVGGIWPDTRAKAR